MAAWLAAAMNTADLSSASDASSTLARLRWYAGLWIAVFVLDAGCSAGIVGGELAANAVLSSAAVYVLLLMNWICVGHVVRPRAIFFLFGIFTQPGSL